MDSDTAPAPDAHTPPVGGARFFAWLRRIGPVRHEGWLGGVSGAIAARVGIDQIIIRGLFVVGAVLGFPVLLAYGLLWALLPDERDEIHAENLLRGRFDPPLVAALVIVALGFLPVMSWLSELVLFPLADSFGPRYFTARDAVGTVSRLALVVLAASAAIALVRWIRRTRRARHDIGEAAPAASVPRAAPDDAALRPPRTAAPPYEPGLAYQEWRRQHEAWLAQHDAWRGAQHDADRMARAKAAAERQQQRAARSRAAAAAAAARRAANPRTHVGFVVLVLGVAAAAAAGAVILLGSSGLPIAIAAALFAAALVAAVGMIVAGILRRRSGFLTAVAVCTLFAAVGVSAYAAPLALAVGREATAIQLNPGGDVVFLGEGGDYVQLRGLTRIEPPHDGRTAAVSVTKGRGDTYIRVPATAAVQLTATLDAGSVTIEQWDKTATTSTTHAVAPADQAPGVNADRPRTFNVRAAGPSAGDTPSAVYPVTLSQRSGDVYIALYEDPAK